MKGYKIWFFHFTKPIHYTAITLLIFVCVALQKTSYGQFIHPGYAVCTHLGSSAHVTISKGYPFTVYDLSQTNQIPIGTIWEPPLIFPNNADSLTWSADSVGAVYGVTFDKRGNIYLTATGVIQSLLIDTGMAGGGGIYRLDYMTGKCQPFVFSNQSPVWSDSTKIPNTNSTGLGNICYNKWHDMFYVTNFEDGMIYRIDTNGVIVDRYDPFLPDNGTNGMALAVELLWGLEIIKTPTGAFKLLFGNGSTGSTSTIWSVGIDPLNGGFIPALFTVEIVDTNGYGNPLSDISFNGYNAILVSERGDAHASRMLEYKFDLQGWSQARQIYLGRLTGIDGAGGNDYGIYNATSEYCDGSLTWGTSNSIYLSDTHYGSIYGFMGVLPSGNSFNLQASDFVTNAALTVDHNYVYNDVPKSRIFDIEIFRYNGCYNTDFNLSNCILSNCILPNVITPNNDGLNDCLQFDCKELMDCPLEISIFNRWGERIYHSENYQNCWRPMKQSEEILYYIITNKETGEQANSFLHVFY